MLRIYKASAGSGKTYTLVREYLRLALAENEAFKHILAVTFTNKAAAEMKSRVIESLKGISEGIEKYDQLTLELCRINNKDEDVLRKSAAKVLRHLLHHYADISIGTIDSFMHRVVRAFAYDLHLPMNFDVEMDSTKLLTEAVELLLDRLNEADKQVTMAVLEFSESRLEEGKDWRVERDIAEFGSELFRDDAIPHLKQLSEVAFAKLYQARKSLYAHKTSIEQKLFAIGKEAMDFICRQGLNPSDFYQGKKGLYGFFASYNSKIIPNDIKGNRLVLQTIIENNWGKKSPLTEPQREQLVKCYKHIESVWDEEGSDYYLCDLLLKNFYSFILLTDLQKLIEEIKKDRHLLHISEFQQRVYNIVRVQEAPIIYERMGEWYRHILIDEFQDTSVLQWQNLLPLIENSQAMNEDSLIVGDGKQAIYRFRGGEVSQFAVLPKVYGSEKDVLLKERETVVNNYGTQTISLEENYRSCRAVVDFNNSLYKELRELPELADKEIYDDYFQNQGRSDADGGFVCLEFLDKQDAEGGLVEMYCNRVEQIIEECLRKGYAYRDVAVLSVKNDTGSMVASHLISEGIPVISPESLLLNQSLKVRLLLSLLHYLDRKDDLVARMEIMHFVHLLHQLEIRYEQLNITGSAYQFEKELHQKTQINFDSAKITTGLLTDLLQQLVACFSLDGDDPFLQFFLDEAMQYAHRYGNQITHFLEWWDEVKDKKSIIYPESMDAVRVMTIHKAKGLQFPVVIYLETPPKNRLNKKFFWVDMQKDWAPGLPLAILPVTQAITQTEFVPLYKREQEQTFLDLLNLLYVATTRPEDALFVLSEMKDKEPEKNNSINALLVAFLKKSGRWKGYEVYSFGDANFQKCNSVDTAPNSSIYKKGDTPLTTHFTSAVQIKMNPVLLWSDDAAEKIASGNLLHEVLKQIRYAGDEDRILKKFIAQGEIGEDEQEEWMERLKAILTHPDLEAYFARDCKVLTERPLLRKGHGMKIPDRVVRKGDKTVVIDYKSGQPQSKYVEQICEYADWLHTAGWPVAKKILFYTNTLKAEVVQ